jgi:hypothetical protein
MLRLLLPDQRAIHSHGADRSLRLIVWCSPHCETGITLCISIALERACSACEWGLRHRGSSQRYH